jgi:hypothetical protein
MRQVVAVRYYALLLASRFSAACITSIDGRMPHESTTQFLRRIDFKDNNYSSIQVFWMDNNGNCFLARSSCRIKYDLVAGVCWAERRWNASRLVGRSLADYEYGLNQAVSLARHLMRVGKRELSLTNAKLQKIRNRSRAKRSELVLAVQHRSGSTGSFGDHLSEAHSQTNEFGHDLRQCQAPWNIDAVTMQICADGIRPEVVLKCSLSRLPGKTAAAVSYV